MKPKDMSDEQLRIRVAELLGAKWSYVVDSKFETVWSLSLRYKEANIGSNWLAPRTYFAVHFIVADKPDNRFPKHVCSDLPNWPHDLNAYHEMEKSIDDPFRYVGALSRVITNGEYGAQLPQLIFATARQRCEAFVEVMSK